MQSTSIAHRLKIFRTSTGLTQSAFGEACGISQKTYGNLESGRTQKISSEYLSQIESAFKDLSPNWLRRGVGDMLRSAPATQLPAPLPSHFEEPQGPRYTAPFMMVEPDLSGLTAQQQADFWRARWEKAARQLAEQAAAREQEELVQLVLRAGGKSFSEASAEAADTDEPQPVMVAETNPEYQERQQRRAVGFLYGSLR